MGQWSFAGNMADGRWMHEATLLSSGAVLVTGGDDGHVGPVGAELYTP